MLMNPHAEPCDASNASEEPNLSNNLGVNKHRAKHCDASDASKNIDLSISREESDLTSDVDVDKSGAQSDDANEALDLCVSREQPDLTSNLDKSGAEPGDAN